jgi:hypothetical protein
MVGVSVQIKGTTNAAVTDADGRYSITVPNNNATLVFTSVGHAPQEMKVGDQTSINMQLTESAG